MPECCADLEELLAKKLCKDAGKQPDENSPYGEKNWCHYKLQAADIIWFIFGQGCHIVSAFLSDEMRIELLGISIDHPNDPDRIWDYIYTHNPLRN